MKIQNVTFWKFVSHPITTTHADAEALAKRIEAGEFVPHNSHGECYYKLGGWCYDIGRKPYLIEYSHGHIQRAWALSIAELRAACHLSRHDRVVPDPFAVQQPVKDAVAA